MNGNATTEFDRAPRGGFLPPIGDEHTDPRLSLDRSHIHLRKRKDLDADFSHPPLLFLVCTEAERGPAGNAATVGLHPRVWRLGLPRRANGRRGRARYGERQTKRPVKFVNEVWEHLALGPLSESGLQLEKLRLLLAVGASPAFPSVLHGATLSFLK